MQSVRDLDAGHTRAAREGTTTRPSSASEQVENHCRAAWDAPSYVATKAGELHAILSKDQLRQPPVIQSAHPALVTSEVAVIEALNTQIDRMGTMEAAHFGQHPDAKIYTSQPGLATILAAGVLGEFGDHPHRYSDARARKNDARTSPITRVSGTKRTVLARYAPNRRLGDALQRWAFCSMCGSPGAMKYHQQLRASNIGHQAALRQLPKRLVDILHGCLNTTPARTQTDEPPGPTTQLPQLDSQKLGCLAVFGLSVACRPPELIACAPIQTRR